MQVVSSLRAQSRTASTGTADGETPHARTLVTGTEGDWPPRVLITGGLGQLGSNLAKELRCVCVCVCVCVCAHHARHRQACRTVGACEC